MGRETACRRFGRLALPTHVRSAIYPGLVREQVRKGGLPPRSIQIAITGIGEGNRPAMGSILLRSRCSPNRPSPNRHITESPPSPSRPITQSPHHPLFLFSTNAVKSSFCSVPRQNFSTASRNFVITSLAEQSRESRITCSSRCMPNSSPSGFSHS